MDSESKELVVLFIILSGIALFVGIIGVIFFSGNWKEWSGILLSRNILILPFLILVYKKIDWSEKRG